MARNSSSPLVAAIASISSSLSSVTGSDPATSAPLICEPMTTISSPLFPAASCTSLATCGCPWSLLSCASAALALAMSEIPPIRLKIRRPLFITLPLPWVCPIFRSILSIDDGGDAFRRSRGVGPPQCAVTRVCDHSARDGPGDRQRIRCHRPQAGPVRLDGVIVGSLGQRGARAAGQGGEPARIDPRVAAPEFGEARNAHPAAEPRKDDAVGGVGYADGRGRRAERSGDRIALHRDDRQAGPDRQSVVKGKRG